MRLRGQFADCKAASKFFGFSVRAPWNYGRELSPHDARGSISFDRLFHIIERLGCEITFEVKNVEELRTDAGSTPSAGGDDLPAVRVD